MSNDKIDRAHSAVRLRMPQSHEIAYWLVGPREEIGFNIPSLLRAASLRLLGDMPKGGIQYLRAQWYQRYHLERNLSQPVRFGVIFEENMPAALNGSCSEPALIQVFFWRSKDTDAIKALSELSTPKVAFVDDPEIGPLLLDAGFPAPLICTDLATSLSFIETEARKLPSHPKFDSDESISAKRKIAEDWRDVALPSPQDRFLPLTPNRSQIRQVLAEYRTDFWILENRKPLDLRPESQAATFEAVASVIYAMISIVREETKWRPRLPAAILAFPSFNPLLVEHIRAVSSEPGEHSEILKTIAAFLMTEQDTTTFTHAPKHKGSTDHQHAVIMAGSELSAYLRFFDDVSYLHGSFGNSPYLRAPMKGKSISQHHSYFSPRTFSVNAKERVTIRKIGALATALTQAIDPRALKVLLEYPEAIVGFSDLPIEWLDDDGVPLCFSHDVCRIPETTPTNLLAQFARNQSSSFEIDNTIGANTLIVCGAHVGDPIETEFSRIRKLWTEKNAPWKWAHCTTLEALYDVLEKQRPQLLIIDTHGRFTGNDAGTELQFGNEFLDGNKVIERFPQIPLVVISSCWGAPLYGCANTIAHAFFEAGSFAVTCALLPLDIAKGARLYFRLLNNLKNASKTPLHDTWASFMSHNIRTSYFDDLFTRARDRYPEGLRESDELLPKRAKWQVETMVFHTRKAAFRDAFETVVACFKPEFAERVRKALKDEEFIPEFMFYSTMGRADLVQFSNWNARHFRPRDKEVTVADLQADKSTVVPA